MNHLRRWAVLLLPVAAAAQTLNVQQIISNSVATNHKDFEAATRFNWIEIDKEGRGSKKFHVTVIEGTPYYRLIGLNGRPLSSDREEQEKRKEQQITQKRRSESASERRDRIEKYEKERRRDNAMMEQLTEAFDFTYLGERVVRGHKVYVLKAMPKPGYKPPTMETQVLTGMHGEMWVDQQQYHWVRVVAEVIHPVSIEGFLAEVEPGTRFELENAPVGDGSIWQPEHFSMRSNARVLHVFTRASSEDDSYSDYQPAAAPGGKK